MIGLSQLPSTADAAYKFNPYTGKLDYYESGGGGTAAGGQNAVQYNSGSSTFAGDETKFSFNGTNVGIGTGSPAAPLDVNGTVRAIAFSGPLVGNATTATALAANGSNCSAGNYPLGVDASGAVENCTAVTSSQWTTTNTNDVYLPNLGNVGIGTTLTTTSAFTVMNGNVGIGTWVPAHSLEIKGGNIRVSGSYFTSGSSGSYSNAGVTMSTNGAVPVANVNASSSASMILRGGANAASHLDLESTSGTGTTDYISFLTGSQVERARMDTNGNVGIGTTLSSGALTVMSGNVGIGTWKPGAALSVKSGNVGIGTTNANSSLEVVGDTAISGNLNMPSTSSLTMANFTMSGRTGSGTSVMFSSSPSFSGTMLGGTIAGNSAASSSLTLESTSGSGTTDFIRLLTASQVERMRIDTTGNIGIGTITPNARLTILGNVGIGTLNGDPYLLTVPPSGGMIMQGNLGVGTFAPETKVAIVHNNPILKMRMTDNTSYGEFDIYNASGNYMAFGLDGATNGNDAYFFTSSGIPMGFQAGGSERMRIAAAGNVGIGSADPQAKLDLGTSGSIVSHSSTGVGITIKTGANTACNTTCGTSACWVGFDTGTVGVANSQPVACSDATADRCECLGP